MLKFEKKSLETKPNKTFNDLAYGEFFVWADEPDSLCLKISEGCFLNTSNNIVYTIIDSVGFCTLNDLDIVEDINRSQYSAVFEAEIEINEPIRWTVVK